MADPKTAVFKGETFTLAEDPSQFAIMEFAMAASAGENADDGGMRGMGSLLRLVLETIVESDRDRFLQVGRRERATADDLIEMLGGKLSDDAERPTVQPSGSTDGQGSTEPKSEPNSDASDSPTDGPVKLDLTGRPDLALAVLDMRKPRRAS
jgi:hypothetical protein